MFHFANFSNGCAEKSQQFKVLYLLAFHCLRVGSVGEEGGLVMADAGAPPTTSSPRRRQPRRRCGSARAGGSASVPRRRMTLRSPISRRAAARNPSIHPTPPHPRQTRHHPPPRLNVGSRGQEKPIAKTDEQLDRIEHAIEHNFLFANRQLPPSACGGALRAGTDVLGWLGSGQQGAGGGGRAHV